MSIGQALASYRKEKNLTQQQLAEQFPIDRTLLSRIESGEREIPAVVESKMAGMSWKFALEIAELRTGGFISYLLGDVPNLDLHPAALKDLLLKELAEAETALEGLTLAKHLDPEKRRESAVRVWQELMDVEGKSAILRGILEEEFCLDRKRLIQKHEMETKKGER
ncbi:helix-turn-helix domain-containing protein [Paenibacillus sp. HJGM_3]|uniref:helix-turn-helix domain-containing protein n=1 Tax=Paenibacillus sp. HJGM_3 TaxID=3379816 RepID=UPI00385CBAFF